MTDHLINVLKLLDYDFWSKEERLFYIYMYRDIQINKMPEDDMPEKYIKHYNRLLEIIE